MPVLVSEKFDDAKYAEDIRICVEIARAWRMPQGPMNCLFGMESRTADTPDQLVRMLELAPSEQQVRSHLAMRTATCEEAQKRCELIKKIKDALEQKYPGNPTEQWLLLGRPHGLFNQRPPQRTMIYGELKGLQAVVDSIEQLLAD